MLPVALYNSLLADHSLDDPRIYKAAASDPDTLSYDQAMADVDRDEWIKAATAEIRSLEEHGTWREVPKSAAKSRILPGTWVFRRKRTPEGVIKKYKGRYCVRGDLQEGEFDTFAPVAAWPTIRQFIVLYITLGWYAASADFANAFVQATLNESIWIHLPRGFSSSLGPNTCLQLEKSLYGISIAPRLWYEHLVNALLNLMGFVQSKHDKCLFYRKNMLIVLFVDDAGIAAPFEEDVDDFIAELRGHGFDLKKEGDFTEFLGIKFERHDREVRLTQTGLIDKVIAATGLQNANSSPLPARTTALGLDPDGEPMDEAWGYSSIIGMLLYLSTNTRPDITFAVSQVARFSANPKKSHATAVKKIVRYLLGTRDVGMVMRPDGTFRVDLFVDADFLGLFRADPDSEPTSVRSRSGVALYIGNVLTTWQSKLQTKIALNTAEAEYSALSSALKLMIPLLRMLKEMCQQLSLPRRLTDSVRAVVHEDNQAALLLATEQRLSNRTRYFQMEMHWFWELYNDGLFEIVKVPTNRQRADFFTKMLPIHQFRLNRYLVLRWPTDRRAYLDECKRNPEFGPDDENEEGELEMTTTSTSPVTNVIQTCEKPRGSARVPDRLSASSDGQYDRVTSGLSGRPKTMDAESTQKIFARSKGLAKPHRSFWHRGYQS